MAPGSHWAERISLRYTQRCPARMRSAPRALMTTVGSAKIFPSKLELARIRYNASTIRRLVSASSPFDHLTVSANNIASALDESRRTQFRSAAGTDRPAPTGQARRFAHDAARSD